MAKKNKYVGKFVIAYDTLADGYQCMKYEDETPVLFDSHEEAFKEIFDSAHSMLTSRDEEELEEYHEDITKELVAEMGEVLKSDDVKAMEKFFEKYPQCNDNGEWVEKADEFVLGRKAFFTGKGVVITGKKLS